MKIFGLTGGIGMGKTTAASLFQELGAAIIDTDLLARELVAPGQPALNEIRARFGDAIIAQDGQLQRDVLARLVFADAQARHDLEAILHPRIRQQWLAGVEAWRTASAQRARRQAGVVVIPLLFETQAENEFDATVCVACSETTQWERLRKRGWSDQEIQQRSEAQWPIDKKMALADYVLWNEGVLDVLRGQVEKILATAG